MQSKSLTAKPLEEVISAINGLDLESVKVRLMDAELGEGWTREHADSVEAAYKKYLMIVAKNQEQAEEIMLSKDVDEFWHTHILQTMKYMDDCQKVFGSYLHHNPDVSPRTEAVHAKRAALIEKTRKLYEEAAYCTAAIRSMDAAYCTAAVAPQQAAYCTAAIRSQQTAYCTAAIEPTQAAYCTAAIEPKQAAYCTASIEPKQAAYCTASIEPKQAAYCTAAVHAD